MTECFDMSDSEIIGLLNKWQQDGQNKTNGVFVRSFTLTAQSSGFYLNLELHADGLYADNCGDESLFGTLQQVFEKAVELIEERKATIRRHLED